METIKDKNAIFSILEKDTFPTVVKKKSQRLTCRRTKQAKKVKGILFWGNQQLLMNIISQSKTLRMEGFLEEKKYQSGKMQFKGSLKAKKGLVFLLRKKKLLQL